MLSLRACVAVDNGKSVTVVTVVMHIRRRLRDDRFYVARVRDLVTNLARKLHCFET
jgi:hypothetical protein